MTVIYGLVLAGGQGKRLNYQEKGFIKLGGQYLVQHVINAISAHVRHILISANQHTEQYRDLGYQIVEDDFGSFEGPLAGLRRAMIEISRSADDSALIQVVPCDAPLLPDNLVERLIQEHSTSDAPAVIPHDGHYLQPLFGLYSLKLLPSLDNYLKKGNRKVSSWVESVDPRIVDYSDQAELFLNINTKEDLAVAEQMVERRSKKDT